MKSLKLTATLIFIISTSIFYSCAPENMDYVSSTKEIISQGKWSVAYYYAGQDKTAQYSTYQFSFTGNGNVTVSNGTNSFSGTWSTVTDINRNEVLRINLGQEPHLQELSEQWCVSSCQTDVVSMKVNGNELRIRKL